MVLWPSICIGLQRWSKNTIVFWTITGHREFGFCRGVVEAQEKPFLVVSVLEATCEGTFKCSGADEVMVDCAIIEGFTPHIHSEGVIRLLVPL